MNSITLRQKIKNYVHSHLTEMIDLRRATDQELQRII